MAALAKCTFFFFVFLQYILIVSNNLITFPNHCCFIFITVLCSGLRTTCFFWFLNRTPLQTIKSFRNLWPFSYTSKYKTSFFTVFFFFFLFFFKLNTIQDETGNFFWVRTFMFCGLHNVYFSSTTRLILDEKNLN